jgi:hypothetical protein
MPEYTKVSAKRLRTLGGDEQWLQRIIAEDPSILGLGNVDVIEVERKMTGGGRLDLLLGEKESEIRYEVELMLGKLDESHIIRTIEYWDIERRRYPDQTHYAVIVAEDITSRFLNVISLLNKSVPLIALQMSALDLGGKVGLSFTRVLDLTETFGDKEAEDEQRKAQVTRQAWETDGYSDSLKVVDSIVDVLKEQGVQARVTYTNQYVAIASTGSTFVWCHPRKNGGLCHLEFNVGVDAMDEWFARMAEADVGEVSHGRKYVKFSVSAATFGKRREVLAKLIGFSEGKARK